MKDLLILVIVALATVSFVGCGKSNSEKESEVKETTSIERLEDETIIEETSGEEEFDFSQVFDNLEVNGRHIPFPFTLNDLGEGFEIRYVTEMGNGSCCGTLYYNDEQAAGVFMKIEDKEEFDSDTEVYWIALYSSYEQIFKVKGIGCNDSIDKVKQSFAGMEELYNSDNVLTKLEKDIGNGTFFMVFRHEDGTLSIDIAKGN